MAKGKAEDNKSLSDPFISVSFNHGPLLRLALAGSDGPV